MTRQPVIRSALLFAMALLASTLSIKATAAEVVHRVTQISYDSMERVQCTAVRMDSTQWTGQSNACVPQTSGSLGADRVTKNVYDAAGQLVQVREGVGTSVEAAEATYSYTIAGKREFVIDANGNRAQLIYDGTGSFVYDAENRLVSATAAGQTTTLAYDPLGRLWQVVKGAANTRLLYDGDALAAEYNSGGMLTKRHVHGSNAAADDPLVWYTSGATSSKRWLHSATTSARSSQRMVLAAAPRSTPTTNTESPARATWGGSSSPARRGLPSSA